MKGGVRLIYENISGMCQKRGIWLSPENYARSLASPLKTEPAYAGLRFCFFYALNCRRTPERLVDVLLTCQGIYLTIMPLAWYDIFRNCCLSASLIGGILLSRTLVAYFSAGGNTRRVAKMIAEAAGADIYEIKPVQPYSHADLNWMDNGSRSTLEMNDPASRPEIVEPLPDMGGYDTLLLGFPIWWYTCPAIIRTFLEGVDTKGKKIVPFATSGGSELGGTAGDIKRYAQGAEVLPGRMMNGWLNTEDVKAWLAELN